MTLPPEKKAAIKQRDFLLVKQALSGDEGAFAKLFNYYTPRLERYVAHQFFKGDIDTARDAVQESMISAHTYLKDFRGDCAFSSWLTTIARHEAFRILAQQKKDSDHTTGPGLDDEGDEINPYDNIEGQINDIHGLVQIPDSAEAHCARMEFLEGLTSHFENTMREDSAHGKGLRWISLLVSGECQSYQEVADLAGIPLNTVRTEIFRARAHLHEIIDPVRAEFRDKAFRFKPTETKVGPKVDQGICPVTP